MHLGSRTVAILRAAIQTAGYLAAVVWLTWPLGRDVFASMPATRGACWFDMYYSAWALSHDSRALTSAPLHIADGNIFHPAASTLFYGPSALGAVPLFAPTFLVTGNPALAVNVTFLLGLALTGAAMHEVVRRWTGSDLAGVVAAMTVLLNDWLIRGFVPTAPHWAALYGFPIIAFLSATRLDSIRAVIWLVSLIVLQALVDLAYVAPAVVGPLGVLAICLLCRRHTRSRALRLTMTLALALLILSPIVLEYVRVRAANPNLEHQTMWSITEADMPFALPLDLVYGSRPLVLAPATLILLTFGIAAALYLRRKSATRSIPGGWAHGALWATVGCILSLTPTVTVAGRQFTSPLGYATEWLPSLHVIRVPSRIGIAGLVGVGILSGMAFSAIVAFLRLRLRRPLQSNGLSIALAASTVALLYGAYNGGFGALPGATPRSLVFHVQQSPRIPDSFAPVLAASTVPLVEVPLGYDGFNPIEHGLAIFHAILHRHPVLNGYSSYWPVGFPERIAEANNLPAIEALDRLVETTGLGLVWVHADRLNPEQRAAWGAPSEGDLTHARLMLVAQEDTQMLFAVRPPALAGADVPRGKLTAIQPPNVGR